MTATKEASTAVAWDGVVHRYKSASTHRGLYWTYCRRRFALDGAYLGDKEHLATPSDDSVDCLACLAEMP